MAIESGLTPDQMLARLVDMAEQECARDEMRKDTARARALKRRNKLN